MKKILLALFIALQVQLAAQAQQLNESKVPANIKSAATAKAGGQKINMWTLDKNRGKYIGTILTKEVFKHIEVSTAGKWLQTTQALPPAKVPANVMAAVKSNYLSKGYKGSNYTYIEDAAKGKYYKVDVSSDDEDLTLTISTAGKITKKETR